MVSTDATSTQTNTTSTQVSLNHTQGRCNIAGCESDFRLYKCRNNQNGSQKYVHHLPCGTNNKHLQEPGNEMNIFCSTECKDDWAKHNNIN